MKNVLLLLTSLLVVSCAKLEELPFTDAKLEGPLWATSCYSDTNGNYTKSSVRLSGGSYRHQATLYSDGSCSTPTADLIEIGSYQIGEAVVEGSMTYKLDRTYSSFKLKPRQPSLASGFNSQNFCGFNTWLLNVEHDVTGLTCGSSLMPNAGEKFYDVYVIWPMTIPGSVVEGDLNFGFTDTTYDGKTPQNRPTSVGDPTYRKQ